MLKDNSASVHQRLLNKARSNGRPFDELFQYFVIERFLYRLSTSKHRDQFVLKGALLFRVWTAEDSRATRDIDFLAYGDNSIDSIIEIVKEIIAVNGDDGIVFDLDSIDAQQITEGADYEGKRVVFRAYLGKAVSRMQLDIAFGDVVNPLPETGMYPTVLDHAAPELWLYPPESVFAEKLEAMIDLGSLNSRMKDFFDLWRMAQQFEFDGAELLNAVSNTLSNRKTEALPYAVLKSELTGSSDKQKQWAGFLEKSQLSAPHSFADLLEQLEQIISPILDSVLTGGDLVERWKPGGPWIKK
ncbi:hypothetical protein AB833_05045 [Chromatiales bacterium (ex Bugula neritina AB1)]|nr:hypothetical protein AB833_05045 [Chromatiales bacterium (ex Bugula neritina AB1)]